MNKLISTKEKTMTVKEVAEILGYKPDTIQKKAKELERTDTMFGRIEIRTDSSHALLLNKNQVQIIKNNLVPRTLDMKVRGQNAVTELEKQETIILAMKYLQEGYNEMKQRAEVAEKTNAILMHVNRNYTATEIAKECGLRSASELNKILEEKGIQYKVNDVWVPSADYSDKGYFDIKQEVLDNGKVVYYRKITQLGREFIVKLLKDTHD